MGNVWLASLALVHGCCLCTTDLMEVDGSAYQIVVGTHPVGMRGLDLANAFEECKTHQVVL
jgi:hypothetical protein